MWRLTVASALAALFVALSLSSHETPAHACSGPATDRVAESEVIVEGWITNYSTILHPPDLYEDPKTGELFEYRLRRATERMDLEVLRVLKGTVSAQTVAVLYDVWAPGSQLGGECGGVARDKSGSYIIAGLSRTDTGAYRAGWTRWFYVGPGPSDDRYHRVLESLASYPAAAGLPALGTGPAPATTTHHFIAGLAAAGAALLATSIVIGRRTHRT